MTTYVDKPHRRLGRMMMCHMMADTTPELLDMAARIGVDQKWIQDAGTYREHFDICKSKRALAIQHGALAVGARAIGTLLQGRKVAR